ncbi:uncharacterized protein LOC122810564 [Protopterus annectens]|uniref:uncharacterized protein LOC122810564 n=1 Tax=Protopterus annectens TaxID=7888 RepID=UPI001CFB04BF|nr:uncharacterized protein LOC122810564 [Protopterus annectens]
MDEEIVEGFKESMEAEDGCSQEVMELDSSKMCKYIEADSDCKSDQDINSVLESSETIQEYVQSDSNCGKDSSNLGVLEYTEMAQEGINEEGCETDGVFCELEPSSDKIQENTPAFSHKSNSMNILQSKSSEVLQESVPVETSCEDYAQSECPERVQESAQTASCESNVNGQDIHESEEPINREGFYHGTEPTERMQDSTYAGCENVSQALQTFEPSEMVQDTTDGGLHASEPCVVQTMPPSRPSSEIQNPDGSEPPNGMVQSSGLEPLKEIAIAQNAEGTIPSNETVNDLDGLVPSLVQDGAVTIGNPINESRNPDESEFVADNIGLEPSNEVVQSTNALEPAKEIEELTNYIGSEPLDMVQDIELSEPCMVQTVTVGDPCMVQTVTVGDPCMVQTVTVGDPNYEKQTEEGLVPSEETRESTKTVSLPLGMVKEEVVTLNDPSHESLNTESEPPKEMVEIPTGSDPSNEMAQELPKDVGFQLSTVVQDMQSEPCMEQAETLGDASYESQNADGSKQSNEMVENIPEPSNKMSEESKANTSSEPLDIIHNAPVLGNPSQGSLSPDGPEPAGEVALSPDGPEPAGEVALSPDGPEPAGEVALSPDGPEPAGEVALSPDGPEPAGEVALSPDGPEPAGEVALSPDGPEPAGKWH